MTAPGKKARVTKLSSGRPPTSAGSGRTIFSAKIGRGIIRTHHRLSKALRDAEDAGDTGLQARLRTELESNGGLKAYQEASLLGQSGQRGGDSSKVLVEWLTQRQSAEQSSPVMRVLEVGALSTANACSRWKRMDVTRIDLHAQSEGIEQQDFMRRPLAKDDAERFDVVSLSLVLNYVPSKEGRGDMLRRVGHFLRSTAGGDSTTLPCVFVVLPVSCILNSRYLDPPRFEDMMRHLGYSQVERRDTLKLIYYLFVRDGTETETRGLFPKLEINEGKTRNNFSIVL